MLDVYTYQGCSTCRNAVKWLRSRGIAFTEHPIRETPPSAAVLHAMLDAKSGVLKELLNTSGLDYRAMGLKDKLPAMSREEVLALLASCGNLVKRPFAIDTKAGIFLTGFRETEWEAAFA